MFLHHHCHSCSSVYLDKEMISFYHSGYSRIVFICEGCFVRSSLPVSTIRSIPLKYKAFYIAQQSKNKNRKLIRKKRMKTCSK